MPVRTARRAYALSGVYAGAASGSASTAALTSCVVGGPVWLTVPLTLIAAVCLFTTSSFLLWCDSTDAP